MRDSRLSEPGLGSAAGEINVGERIRQLRLGLGLSVRTLAAKAGFSPSFISQIELGQVSPSIASLERIVGVLGTTLAQLFSETASRSVAIVRDGDRQRLISSWSRAQVESLVPVDIANRLEAIMITLAPGGHSGTYAHGRTSEQFAMVFSGEATLTIDGTAYVLRAGDAVTLYPDAAYTWENDGMGPTRIILVSARRSH